ncbi:hypothetical protein JNAJLEEC_00016 [Pseudomonas phage phiPA01_302]|uniref:Sulfate/thiosulfate import ATP-binding protein CysA n=1 Tax=Pseudomonas phage PaP4 TaxID=1273709 RepID=L7TIS0_9CAUD|nr:sulfate/thiosulfate import ATP-binding protein CysA [Pseudomonas phage PaP4]AGC35247.1 sulfate/thiosulfate import ATP-binding protein CysA [Pseudomonas phage PaP4]AYD79641.1 hypothetical protein JNAJLEEC_00016 [Pseudomonas phage phiPA01_302]UYE90144.1 sulfate/thiosulfate import ATP-binding protein [Pseudomonas phage PaeP_Ls]
MATVTRSSKGPRIPLYFERKRDSQIYLRSESWKDLTIPMVNICNGSVLYIHPRELPVYFVAIPEGETLKVKV